MNVILLLARVALAAVFGIAGIAKLFDLKGSRTAMVDFGLPDWLGSPLGFSLPFSKCLLPAFCCP
jgi:uncharacterized membrane protein YphA (DoxX/SURF4 family)